MSKASQRKQSKQKNSKPDSNNNPNIPATAANNANPAKMNLPPKPMPIKNISTRPILPQKSARKR